MATPDFTLAAGMTVVVQPNVTTRDGRAGVQTGELLLVTERGPERLHTFPRGLQRADLTGGRRLFHPRQPCRKTRQPGFQQECARSQVITSETLT